MPTARSLSSRQILDTVRARPSAGVQHGKLRHLATAVGLGSNTSNLRGSQRQWDFARVVGSPDFAARSDVYDHPRNAAYRGMSSSPSGGSRAQQGRERELTPADIAWLQNLPRDPAQVSHADAAELAGIAASLRTSQDRPSRRLVESLWGPVEAHHDLQQARVELDNAKRPWPAMPASTLGALADALLEENPTWHDDIALGEANRLLQEALAHRATQAQAAVDQAQTNYDRALAAVNTRRSGASSADV